MSTMADIIDSIARAFSRRDMERVRVGLIQAAAKVGGRKGEIIADILGTGSSTGEQNAALQLTPRAVSGQTSGWQRIAHGRKPWLPERVAAELARWSEEMAHADALVAAGERCMPLLLVGETRCGKTSAALEFARSTGRDVHRLDASAVVKSYMGESARMLKEALNAVAWMGNSVFVIDEVDAIAMRRSGDAANDKERSHLVGCLLTWLEDLPPHVPLICTTNRLDAIDSAFASRMTVVTWPSWKFATAEILTDAEKADFLAWHGAPGRYAQSYAEAVAIGRRIRIDGVLASAKAAS